MTGTLAKHVAEYLRAGLPGLYIVAQALSEDDAGDLILVQQRDGGRSEGYPVQYSEVPIQIRARAGGESDAETLIYAAYARCREIEHGLTLPALDETGSQSILVAQFLPIQEPAYLGFDSGWHWYSFNVMTRRFRGDL